MISLLLHKSEAKLRTSVNNKDIVRIHLRYNWLISQKTVPINASFVKQQAIASGYVHSIDDIFLSFHGFFLR